MPALTPRNEWSGRIKELERTQSRISDLIDFPQKDQQRTNFCWFNGPVQAANMALRIANVPFKEWSAASGACLITNYQNVGGWGIDAVKALATTGVCTVDLWPNAAIDRKYDTPASRADRANHQVLEWIDVPCNGLDAIMTCLLQPWAGTGGFDAWSHEVAICDPVEPSPGVFGLRVRNSWGQWGDVNQNGVDGFKVLLEGDYGWPSDFQAVRVADDGQRAAS